MDLDRFIPWILLGLKKLVDSSLPFILDISLVMLFILFDLVLRLNTDPISMKKAKTCATTTSKTSIPEVNSSRSRSAHILFETEKTKESMVYSSGRAKTPPK